MRAEHVALTGTPLPQKECGYCGIPFEEENDVMMRGQVQSGWRRLLGLPYCAVICSYCKSVSGYGKQKGAGKP